MLLRPNLRLLYGVALQLPHLFPLSGGYQERPSMQNRRETEIQENGKDGEEFSVLILAIFLATMVDTVILDFQNPLHLANYLAAIYCGVQLVSILENESTCNGAAWARVMQKIVADKTERHFNVKLTDLMKEATEEEEPSKGKKVKE